MLTQKGINRIADTLGAVIDASARTRNNLRRYIAESRGETIDPADLEPEHAAEIEETMVTAAIEDMTDIHSFEDEPEEDDEILVLEQTLRPTGPRPSSRAPAPPRHVFRGPLFIDETDDQREPTEEERQMVTKNVYGGYSPLFTTNDDEL